MKNTEITVQVFDDYETIKNKLLKSGFTETEILTGNDYYFSTLKKSEISKASYPVLISSSIILRSVYENFSKQKFDTVVYKNKTLDENQNVLSEEKFSTKVDNIQNLKIIFALAGLENWVTLRQENHFFKSGEMTVIVGKVEGLDGCFIEIEEFDSIVNLKPEEKIEKLKSSLNEFSFKTGDDFSVKKSYLLFLKQFEER